MAVDEVKVLEMSNYPTHGVVNHLSDCWCEQAVSSTSDCLESLRAMGMVPIGSAFMPMRMMQSGT